MPRELTFPVFDGDEPGPSGLDEEQQAMVMGGNLGRLMRTGA